MYLRFGFFFCDLFLSIIVVVYCFYFVNFNV